MAPEVTLACPRNLGESYSDTCISPPTSRLVVRREKCTLGSAVASPKTRSASVYRRLKRGWGTHLGDFTVRDVWSDTESRLHINFLELKAVFLALKSFGHLCRDQIVLVAMDNTTVVSYINKEGGMKSGSLCDLLWRLLYWCHPRGIVLRSA